MTMAIVKKYYSSMMAVIKKYYSSTTAVIENYGLVSVMLNKIHFQKDKTPSKNYNLIPAHPWSAKCGWVW
jgi:hypothetical protein